MKSPPKNDAMEVKPTIQNNSCLGIVDEVYKPLFKKTLISTTN